MFTLIKDTITTQLNRRTSYNKLYEYSSFSNRRENRKQRAKERASTVDLSLSRNTPAIPNLPPPPYSVNSNPRKPAHKPFGEDVLETRPSKKAVPPPDNGFRERVVDEGTATVLPRDNLRRNDENRKPSDGRPPRRSLSIPIDTLRPNEIDNGVIVSRDDIKFHDQIAWVDENRLPEQPFPSFSNSPRKRDAQTGAAVCKRNLQRLEERLSDNPILGLKFDAGPSRDYQPGGRHFSKLTPKRSEREDKSSKPELQRLKCDNKLIWDDTKPYKVELERNLQELEKRYGSPAPFFENIIGDTVPNNAGTSHDSESRGKHPRSCLSPASVSTHERSYHKHHRCGCQYCNEVTKEKDPKAGNINEDMNLALKLQKRWDKEDTQLRKQRAFALSLQDGNYSNAAMIQQSIGKTSEASSPLGENQRHCENANITASRSAKSTKVMENLTIIEVPALENQLAKAHTAVAEALSMLDRYVKEEDAKNHDRETVRAGLEKLESELRRKKQTKCISCMEVKERSLVAVLGCKHEYCGDCIADAFKSAKASREEFKCCGMVVPISHGLPFLPKAVIIAYRSMVLERSTLNPKYCSKITCNAFIPPKNIRGPVCTCAICKTRTCRDCGKKEHPGVCSEDDEGKKVQSLAAKKGWKTCRSCGWILERNHGCLHMTCRCGAQWCYNCLKDWELCKSTCQRR